MYHMMIDHWYKHCDQRKNLFIDTTYLKEDLEKESHIKIPEEHSTDEDQDISLDEEQLERLQAELDEDVSIFNF